MKAKTIGYFKNVQNVGYCIADADMKVGMGVILDRAAKTAKLPASEDDAKKCHRIVTNIHDKPQMCVHEEPGTVLKGEYVRADDLLSVVNMEVEFSDDEVTDDMSTLSAGDKLVFAETTGLLKKSEDATGYAVYFEVVEKTAYRGKGVLAVIRAGE